ncbi:7-carboxy-7-deazaguanine synthase QueE [bacterium]
MIKAHISEIFSSIQGEGIYCGQRQIFIRFSGCNLSCDYCDAEQNQNSAYGDIYSVRDVINSIKKLSFPYALHKAVSLTGGEPLIQSEFINKLIPELKKLGLSVYLETNGTCPDELNKVIKQIDIISCDIKLKSFTKHNIWPLQKKFLNILNTKGKKFFLKIVFSNKLDKHEIFGILEKIALLNIDYPICLQPVTINNVVLADEKFTASIQKYGLKLFKDVYVIPQVHKILFVK